jgi:hypothetical protein
MEKMLALSTSEKSFHMEFKDGILNFYAGSFKHRLPLPVLFEYDMENDKNLIYLVIPDKTGLSLKDKQELVGGYIDVVSGHTQYNSKDPIFVINDEGKFVDDHYANTFPTLFGRKNRYICNDDYFAGPVLCVTSESMQ